MQTGYLAARLVAFALGAAQPEIDDSVSYDELLRFSKEQSIAALVAAALEKIGKMPDEYAAAFRNEKRLSMAREATQEIEMREIACELQKRNIKHMLLKGSVLKQLYPLPYLRTMCDVDIQYDTARKAEITALMRERGYTLKSEQGTDNVNISFVMPPFMNIEFHGVLMDSDIPAYNAYFGTNFERTYLKHGSEVQYSDEDFFVFMVAHTAKHYFYGGTGIRSVADIWLYFRSKPQLDMQYIMTELEKIDLDVFYETILGVAKVLFEGAKPDESQKNICEYLFNSKTYGVAQHMMVRKVEKGNKAGYLLNRLFPGRQFMSVNYPAVKKCTLLLPLFWVVRLIKVLAGGGLKNSDVGIALTEKKSSFDARNIKGKPEIFI